MMMTGPALWKRALPAAGLAAVLLVVLITLPAQALTGNIETVDGAEFRPAAYASCGGTTIVDTEAELNAAITDFNGQTATCAYEIEFGATIALSADLNVINNTDTDVSLLIDGAGFILDGDDLYDLINVQQTIDVTIDRLTITRASGDGVIATDSNLRVSRSTIIDNGSDGIDTNDSSLVLIDSTVTDNNGDGVEIQATGGTPEHVIINSTIVDNSFRGIVVFEADVLLTNVTVYDNESGLALSGTSNGTVNNSILGRQTNDCLVGTGTIDINHSLIEDSTTACGATDGVDGNIVGLSAVLGELGDYGGPTETMPPLAVTGCTTITSPAIDAGDDALAEDEDGNPLAFDQRGTGFPRIVDNVDMGAVEGPLAFVCTDPPPNAVTNETELNQAIADFNSYNGLGVYEIEFGFNIILTADLTVINNTNPGVSLLIDGAGFILDGDDLHNLINIQQTADVTIDRLTVTRATDDAIVANDSNLRVSRSTIIDNGSDGIDTGDSTLVLIDSTVTENSGDGVDVTGTNGLFTPAHVIINSTIADNAFRGIVVFSADVLLTHVTVYDNQSGLVLSGTSNATVNNSILGQHVSDCLVDTGTADFNFSLIEDSATACGATDGVDGNIVGQSAALGTLGDNGGLTETIPPLSDTSPPVDAGDNTLAVDENGDPLAGDQRGFEPRNFNGTVDMGAYEVGAVSPSACPVDPAFGTVGSKLTTLYGQGMGSPTRSKMVAKVTIPNASNLTDLYSQMAAKEYNGVRYVRFIFGDKSYQQVQPATDLGDKGAISWWGDDLTTQFQSQNRPFVKGRWFLQKGMKKMRIPRAIVFYATHDTADDYANAWSTFTYPDNFVAGTNGFDQTNTNILEIPETQATTDIVVQLAVTDVNRDPRTVDVIVRAGGVEETTTLTGPTNKKSELLDIFEVTLEGVPADVDEIEIELVSAPDEGDSAALLGAAAHYACEPAAP